VAAVVEITVDPVVEITVAAGAWIVPQKNL
jgi:hypothetical protein